MKPAGSWFFDRRGALAVTAMLPVLSILSLVFLYGLPGGSTASKDTHPKASVLANYLPELTPIRAATSSTAPSADTVRTATTATPTKTAVTTFIETPTTRTVSPRTPSPRPSSPRTASPRPTSAPVQPPASPTPSPSPVPTTPPASTAVAPALPAVSATWLWNTSLIASEPGTVIAFARAQRVNTIYLQINYSVTTAQYAAFIGAAHAAAIQVIALNGAPQWGLASDQSDIQKWVEFVAAYNQSVPADERFAGLHVDIEPYLLSEWSSDPAAVISQWMANIQYFVATAHSQAGLPASADLAFWLDSIMVPGTAEPLGHWMVSQLDQVTIMAYRTTATGSNSILQVAGNELADASALGKTAVIGVDITDSGSATSFYTLGAQDMENQLAVVQQNLGNDRYYAGYSVNDFDVWSALA